jgi:hypothetical protein
MSIVADFEVPAEAFCLGGTLRAVPDATVEPDRTVAHSPEHVMPFVWVRGGERTSLDDAMADDRTVESAVVTDSFDGTCLYHITWADVVGERLHLILDHDGVVLEACGSGETWRLRVRFDSRDHFSEFRGHFERFGEITVRRLTSPSAPADGSFGVSEKQREALLAAYDAGYYETPSAATGEELAERLGVTQQSVSRRLRRGMETLIEHTLGRRRED